MEGALVVTSVIDGKEMIRQTVSAGVNTTNVEISRLSTGIYNLTYISNGVPVDNKRFYK